MGAGVRKVTCLKGAAAGLELRLWSNLASSRSSRASSLFKKSPAASCSGLGVVSLTALQNKHMKHHDRGGQSQMNAVSLSRQLENDWFTECDTHLQLRTVA